MNTKIAISTAQVKVSKRNVKNNEKVSKIIPQVHPSYIKEKKDVKDVKIAKLLLIVENSDKGNNNTLQLKMSWYAEIIGQKSGKVYTEMYTDVNKLIEILKKRGDIDFIGEIELPSLQSILLPIRRMFNQKKV